MNDLIVVQKIARWEKLKALVVDSVSFANHQESVQHGAGRVPASQRATPLTTPAKQKGVQAKLALEHP